MKIEELQEAYERGVPIVPDTVYDALDSDATAIGPSGTIRHIRRMYSLNKVYAGDPLPFAIDDEDVVVTPKLDGIAVALVYVFGQFRRAVTRGDGVCGVDVTPNVKKLKLPSLDRTIFMAQINAEIVASKNVENSRNVAAGSINQLDLSQEMIDKYKLKVVPYDSSHFKKGSWSKHMRNTFEESVLNISVQEYPTDGSVYRIDDIEKCLDLGYTAKYPRWAFAKKERGVQVETTLLDIVWQLSKGGKVTPVAIFQPVVIDGAIIQKATLHNVKYVEDMKFRSGDKILVERSGGIIPHVIGKVQ